MVLFLTNVLLKEKKDFSKIWLAAHWESKLKRYEIYQVNIERSVKDIMDLDIILDLRLSGHLLIGIVKIFSRKTKYLLTECNDIFNRVTIFRSNITDLPLNKLTASMKNITMPELENLDEFNLVKTNEEAFKSHQSHLETITLKETAEGMRLIDDDFEFNENIPINFEEDEMLFKAFNECDNKENGLNKVSQQIINIATNGEDVQNMEAGSDDFRNGSEMTDIVDGNDGSCDGFSKPHVSISKELIPITSFHKMRKEYNELNLEPLTGMLNVERISRRKRKLIDQAKTLDKEKFEKQLCYTFDITRPLEMAPPTKRLMSLKEIGSAEKLLHLPGQKFRNIKIANLYQRNLRIHKIEESASSCDEEPYSIHSPEQPRTAPTEFAMNSPPHNLNAFNCFEGDENEVNLKNENSDSSSNDPGYLHENINMNESPTYFPCEVQHITSSEEATESMDCILQKRMTSLLKAMQELFRSNIEIKFSDLVKNDRRVKVAGKFQSLLLLKKFDVVELMQTKSYDEIFITKGAHFMQASSQFI